MGLFMGKRALRSIWKEISIAELNATSAPLVNQTLLYRPDRSARVLLVMNNTNVDVVFTVCNPECNETELADSTCRLFLFEIPSGGALNFENSGISSFELDAGTFIYYYKSSAGAATSGKVRMIIYG